MDLTVDEHEVVCLIGPSGCGKSTLLRCVNGLEPIQGGEIRIDGDRVSGRGVDVNALRQDVGIVFQSFNLFPHMSVHRERDARAAQGARAAAGRRRRTRPRPPRSASASGTSARSIPTGSPAGSSSASAIVRALAMQPRVMLLDEITSALDPELVSEVLALVRELAREGMTMIIATHEMGFARDVANQVVFLCEGRIEERGTPDQIFRHPEKHRTQMFLRSIVEAGRLEGTM